MSFNFNQYIKDSNATYYEIQNLSLKTTNETENTKQYIYNNLSMQQTETYAIVLQINSLLKTDNQQYTGTISISKDEESSPIVIQNFIIPTIIPKRTISESLNNTIINYEASPYNQYWSEISIGDYIYLQQEDTVYKRISSNTLFLNAFELIGNANSQNGFSAQKQTIEKILTIKGNYTYNILQLNFSIDTGFEISLYKLQELMNNSNFIPYTKIKHVGIQGKSGMQYCINGNELRLTSRGMEELYSFNEENPISSIKVFPKEEDFFLIDYEYIQ